MKIAGTYKLEVPQERAYAMLQDPDVLAKCMPGADTLEKIGEDEYAMRMKLLIASLSGQFEGKVKLLDQQPPNSFRMRVDGNGKIGFLKGEGAISLSPEGPASTAINYEGDVQIGGTMAAVGQRMIDTTSKMMLKRFFDKLAQVASQAAST